MVTYPRADADLAVLVWSESALRLPFFFVHYPLLLLMLAS